MWALGVVLFTMLYGQFPFYDSVPHELFRKIKAADYKMPRYIKKILLIYYLLSSPFPFFIVFVAFTSSMYSSELAHQLLQKCLKFQHFLRSKFRNIGYLFISFAKQFYAAFDVC